MAHPRKQTSLAAAAVAIPFSQKLVLAIKAYLKNDVLDRRPSFDQEEALSQIRLQSVEMTSGEFCYLCSCCIKSFLFLSADSHLEGL